MSIQYHTGDLFELGRGKNLMHCVSADLEMGKGIAVQFKRRFGKPETDGSLNVGTCVLQKIESKPPFFIFHLVTKEKYFHKPTGATLRKALENFRTLASAFEVSEVWLPLIGTGLDRLNWNNDVLPVLEEISASNGEQRAINFHVVTLP